jgi:hypothetical protein
MDGVLAGFRLKHPHLIQIRQAVRLRVVNAQLFKSFRFEAPFFMSPADNANQGLTSRDITARKCAARPSFGGTQL